MLSVFNDITIPIQYLKVCEIITSDDANLNTDLLKYIWIILSKFP